MFLKYIVGVKILMALLAKKPYDGARLNPVEEVLPICFTVQHLTGIGEPAIL